jgi:hypothetical protein
MGQMLDTLQEVVRALDIAVVSPALTGKFFQKT